MTMSTEQVRAEAEQFTKESYAHGSRGWGHTADYNSAILAVAERYRARGEDFTAFAAKCLGAEKVEIDEIGDVFVCWPSWPKFLNDDEKRNLLEMNGMRPRPTN